MRRGVFVFLFLFFVWAVPVSAAPVMPGDVNNTLQGSPLQSTYAPSYPQHIESIGNIENFKLQNWLQAVSGDWPNTFNYLILPVELDANGQARVMNGGGAVGALAGGIDLMIKNKPASSMEYVAYMGNKLHVPGTPNVAYAAGGGFGFNGLSPVLNLWTVMRNLAYFLFAVVFVVVGVMIMTRRKIDPKTVASIQNALPKIIFALIVVTFSYAIAGFMVDLMYVALALIVTVMNSVQGGSGASVENLLSGSIFGFVFSGAIFGVTLGVAQTVGGIVNGILNVQNIPGARDFAGGISGGLAFLIVGIAILVAVFRTWLILIGAFANIILAVIFAPLRLTLDAIPGQNQFSAWTRDLLTNLLTFPLVTILLVIGSYIATYPNPPDVTGFTPPLLGAGNVREVLPFIGLGILLTIPKALDILRETLKAPAFKYGGAWMESINVGRGATQAGVVGSYKFGRDAAFGDEADKWREEKKAGSNPTRWQKGGIGALIKAKSIGS